MRSTYTSFTHSKYFSPAFNSAIFDGPLRIYFAQFHESLALKIYFMIQQNLKAELAQIKEKTKNSKQNLLLMIYPTDETFMLSFESAPPTQRIATEDWDNDRVMGLRGALEDAELDGLIEEVRRCFKTWPTLIPFELEIQSCGL
ncbi:MAG: hypothetical protein IPK04_11155 [Bdellovibrionales bacterium]|nr:hypothetical protein [Bdellovibrionales bacterium]